MDAQLDSGTTDSMTLNNVTNVQDAAGVVVINRIDSDGNEKTASLREYVAYTGTSGSTLTGLTRNADGGTTDQDHAVGSIVEFIPDVVWAQAIIDNLDGTSTDVELNSPKIKTKINDTNGNELVTITATASAENHINVANAADGNSPVISAVGDDTNVGLTLTPKGTGEITVSANDLNLTAAAANVQVAGADPKRGIYVPASAMYGATTSGATFGQIETSTNKVNVKVLDFDKDADEYAHFALPSPLYWDASTVTATPYWTTTSGTTGTVVWAVQGMSYANDDALDQAYGTAVSSTDTFLLANDVHIGPTTSAITIGGTPTAGDWVQFRIYRDVSEDTLDSDARLLGVRITFGIGQYNDA